MSRVDAPTWDVIVIGAGPAGALAAGLAARDGARVLLVERERFPRPKVCGGCLNASALELLEALGLGAIPRDHGRPIDALELGVGGRRASLAMPGGVAISRDILDEELVRWAREGGTTFVDEVRAAPGPLAGETRVVTLAGRDGVREVAGRVVVQASGLKAAPSAGFQTRVSPHARIGTGCHLEGPESESDYPGGRIAMAVGRSGYVGLARTRHGLGIASAIDRTFLKAKGGPGPAAAAILDAVGFPALPAMLSADWSGTLPLTRTTRPLAAERLFLVGDAAGYVEPFTGQGMATALWGAWALQPFLRRAIDGGNPRLAADWNREHGRWARARHRPAAIAAAITRSPRLAAWSLALARAWPGVPAALIRIVNRPGADRPGAGWEPTWNC